MAHLRPLPWRVVETLLFKAGCAFQRQKGSHRIYCKRTLLRPIVLPAHRQVSSGTLHTIAKNLQMTTHEFLDLME